MKQQIHTRYQEVPPPGWQEAATPKQRWNWCSLLGSRYENPKVAVSNSRFRAFLGCIVILSPIPLTLIALGLNMSNFYCDWGYLNDNSISGILGALQFVAKVHDLLIVASVTAIVVHAVLYHLTMKDGISLAALTPAYQLSRARFLFKRAYWVEILFHGQLSLGILIMVAVFLITVANPSAAIAIIPKAGWWPVPPNVLWADFNSSIGSIYITNTTPLWPSQVSTSYIPAGEGVGNCGSLWGIIRQSCPAAGFPAVEDALSNDRFQAHGFWNALVSDYDTSRSLTTVGAAFFGSDSVRKRWSISTSISQIMATSLSRYDSNNEYKHTLGFHGPPLFKPLVQVECAMNKVASSTLIFPHDSLPFPGLDSETTWAVDTSEGWDSVISNRTSDVHLLWTSLTGNGRGPSLLAAFNHNSTNNTFTYTDSSGAIFNGDNQTAFTCSVDARWAPVKTWMVPGNDLDYRIHEDSPFDFAGSLDFLSTPEHILGLQQIQIDPDWAASLNIPLLSSTEAFTMEEIVRSAGWQSTDVWSNGTADEFLNLVAVGMGMMITEGLARLAAYEELVVLASDSQGQYLWNWGNNASLDSIRMDPIVNPDWLQLHFASYRQGWSYGLSGITIKLALGILLLHLAIAIIHTIIVVGSRNVWTTKSWGSVGEILTLAINSDRSEKLQNTCAGINSSGTWGKKLKIRETEPGHLGLVVTDYGDIDDFQRGYGMGGEMPKAAPGRQYGQLRAQQPRNIV